MNKEHHLEEVPRVLVSKIEKDTKDKESNNKDEELVASTILTVSQGNIGRVLDSKRERERERESEFSVQ
ncbi:hypothetical protein M8J76_009548 [Diaphorina citri]|nr:hypothetical protein M8J76_009548 [Diaphorina citri]